MRNRTSESSVATFGRGNYSGTIKAPGHNYRARSIERESCRYCYNSPF